MLVERLRERVDIDHVNRALRLVADIEVTPAGFRHKVECTRTRGQWDILHAHLLRINVDLLQSHHVDDRDARPAGKRHVGPRAIRRDYGIARCRTWRQGNAGHFTLRGSVDNAD